MEAARCKSIKFYYKLLYYTGYLEAGFKRGRSLAWLGCRPGGIPRRPRVRRAPVIPGSNPGGPISQLLRFSIGDLSFAKNSSLLTTYLSWKPSPMTTFSHRALALNRFLLPLTSTIVVSTSTLAPRGAGFTCFMLTAVPTVVHSHGRYF